MNFLLFNPQGTVAAGERNVIVTMVFLMLIIVVPMFVLLFTFAWRYRAKNKKVKYDPETSHAPWKEILLWIAPALIVAALAVLTWRSAHALDPAASLASANPPLTIEVVALNWKWLFIYPAQGIATVNFIEFPEQTPIHFELTADGPAHDAPMSSFWIPQLGSQMYAMAAMKTQLNLIASSTGEFAGKDTEINGKGYAGMIFTARAVAQSDFDAWVLRVKQVVEKTSSTLDPAAYNALVAPSENNPPEYYSSVAPGLFDNIMMKYLMPSPTPQP